MDEEDLTIALSFVKTKKKKCDVLPSSMDNLKARLFAFFFLAHHLKVYPLQNFGVFFNFDFSMLSTEADLGIPQDPEQLESHTEAQNAHTRCNS